MEPRADVRNAADVKQVQRAKRKEDRVDERRRAAYVAVMATAEGRFVMWDLLATAGVFRSVYAINAQIHYNAGKQDFGHELMATLMRFDDDAYLLMEKEARTLLKRDAAETDAAHTAPSSTQGDSDVQTS